MPPLLHRRQWLHATAQLHVHHNARRALPVDPPPASACCRSTVGIQDLAPPVHCRFSLAAASPARLPHTPCKVSCPRTTNPCHLRTSHAPLTSCRHLHHMAGCFAARPMTPRHAPSSHARSHVRCTLVLQPCAASSRLTCRRSGDPHPAAAPLAGHASHTPASTSWHGCRPAAATALSAPPQPVFPSHLYAGWIRREPSPQGARSQRTKATRFLHFMGLHQTCPSYPACFDVCPKCPCLSLHKRMPHRATCPR